MNYVEIDKYVGKEFKKRREILNLSLNDVAGRIKIPKGTYYYYEEGRRSMPYEIYKKACKLYGLDYIKLFDKAQKEMLNKMK